MKTFGTEWKERINKGEFLLGGHIFLPNPAMAEALVCFGYEYIWIDGEHGSFDRDQILSHIIAVNGAGAGAFVRVAAGEPSLIKPVLEMGPDGIIIPMVNTPEDAERVIAACTYPPKGDRGFGPRRANRYGTVGDEEYLASIDAALVKIIQIEHIDAVNNIDAILAVPGIDGVVVGPYDLSGSMKRLGKLLDPAVMDSCRTVVERCKKRGIPCGPSIGPGNDDIISFWRGLDVDFIFCGDDLTFVKMGAEATLGKMAAKSKP